MTYNLEPRKYSGVKRKKREGLKAKPRCGQKTGVGKGRRNRPRPGRPHRLTTVCIITPRCFAVCRPASQTGKISEGRRPRDVLLLPHGVAAAAVDAGGGRPLHQGLSRCPRHQDRRQGMRSSASCFTFPSAPGQSARACFLLASCPTPAGCSWVLFFRLSCFVSRVVQDRWICRCVCRVVWTIDSRILATD